MANKDDVKTTLPPYLPFKTFHSFIKRLQETVVPRRIDTTLLRAYSGSVQSQLRGTLRFLGLVDEADQTTDRLRELVGAYDKPEWQSCLSRAISDAYGELTSGLDLRVATRGELEERFKTWGADGDVLRKGVAFYVAATAAAGMTLSPHIIAERRGRPAQAPRKTKRSKQGRAAEPDDQDEEPIDEEGKARFNIPIPGKTPALIILPEDATMEDWDMLDVMMKAYMQRREKTE